MYMRYTTVLPRNFLCHITDILQTLMTERCHGTFPDFRTIMELLQIHGTFTDSGITESFVNSEMSVVLLTKHG